jgi:hypothetical protein
MFSKEHISKSKCLTMFIFGALIEKSGASKENKEQQ